MADFDDTTHEPVKVTARGVEALADRCFVRGLQERDENLLVVSALLRRLALENESFDVHVWKLGAL